MKIDDIVRQDFQEVGLRMHRFISDLYPICRSITGEGLRETLRRVTQHIPLDMREAATGERVFDWTIPKEWNIRDAYVKNSKGEKVIDFQQSNLHVLNYSTPIHAKLSLAELKPHLYSSPEHPEWIPYRTSYYKESWGFCISDKQRVLLEEDEYEVCIDSTLESGHLTYGEYLVSGQTEEEIFISCHSCHPSLCNDNLSGIALATFLAKLLTPLSLRYSYRFLFAPGAIGAITWLARNESTASRIKHGLVVACVGDQGHLTYKKSRRGDAEIDRAVEHVLKHCGRPYEIREFSPYGYDERQYCSPGFNLPVGSLTRTPHGEFPQYHTSADDLGFVRSESLADSLSAYINIIRLLEQNKKYVNQNAKCEPQLGKRGIYRAMGGQLDQPRNELAMLWVLNLSDGGYSLLDIATRSGLPFETIHQATEVLVTHGLLKEYDGF